MHEAGSIAPAQLRAELTTGTPIIPGCHDPLSARLAAEAGARAVFVSGGAVGRALFGAPSIPRWGAETYLDYVRHICRSSPIPVIVDGEDGFGEPMATCAAAAGAGAAGVVIGDCLPGGGLLPADVFADTISRIRTVLDVVVVARTDGLDDDRAGTLARLRRYSGAGADITVALLNSVLQTETTERLLATIGELAVAAGGTLAVHSRHGRELPPPKNLPSDIKAIFVTAISVPTSTDHLKNVLNQR
ncbi:isocitrate lyase/phosphoenolpyruvate mutase family protein [Microbispora siamensis]